MPTLTASLNDQFVEEGYVVVPGILEDADFEPLYSEWNQILDGIADELIGSGELKHAYRELPFRERLVAVFEESGRNVMQPFDISLPQKEITSTTPFHVSATIFRILTHPRLLDVAQRLIGMEIVSNPIQHVRMKLPRRALSVEGTKSYQAAQVPWHQDQSVVLPEADESQILSCWLAITDATEENGCLQVIPGSHRGDLLDHCPGEPQLGIPDKLVPSHLGRPIPMEKGSALFFPQKLIHASLDNTTEGEVRISLDLRYHRNGVDSGRPMFPSFLARSAETPERVLADPDVWAQMWYDARARLAEDGTPKFNRWDPDSPVCA